MDLLNFINSNSGAILALSTIILVLITAFYAWQTYKTNKLIYRQVSPNINLEIISLTSALLNKDFINKIKESVYKSSHSMINIRFMLAYSIINQSASCGTIEKPELILTCQTNQMQIILYSPKKRSSSPFYKTKNTPSEILATRKLWEEEGEWNNTVYLRAGEKKNLEDAYCQFIQCEKPDKKLLHFINNAEKIDYQISYINELGKKKFITIENNKIKMDKMIN